MDGLVSFVYPFLNSLHAASIETTSPRAYVFFKYKAHVVFELYNAAVNMKSRVTQTEWRPQNSQCFFRSHLLSMWRAFVCCPSLQYSIAYC